MGELFGGYYGRTVRIAVAVAIAAPVCEKNEKIRFLKMALRSGDRLSGENFGSRQNSEVPKLLETGLSGHSVLSNA